MPKPRTRDEEREYRRRYRARKKAQAELLREPDTGGVLPGMPTTHAALDKALAERYKRFEGYSSMDTRQNVLIELTKLDAFTHCPAIAKAAVDMAEILDLADQRSQHTSAAAKLLDLMREVRSIVNTAKQQALPQETEDDQETELLIFRPPARVG